MEITRLSSKERKVCEAQGLWELRRKFL